MVLFRVKIRYLILLLLSVNLSASGQSGNNTIIVNWKSPVTVADSNGKPVLTLNFEKAYFAKESNYLPVVSFTLSGDVSEFKITQSTTVALSAEEQKIVQSKNIGAIPQVRIEHYPNFPYTYIYVFPIRAGNGGFEKMTSFEYSYQSNPPVIQESRSPNRNARIAATGGASVLSSGTWYKLQIQSTGMYKIDYAFLQSIGINPDNINPQEIKIFGNGGGMLPQANSAFRHDDLTENPILSVGESDGKFDKSDYVLFYAEGPDGWSYDSVNRIFVHAKNLYSDENFYFLTISPGNGLRVQTQAQASNPQQTINTYNYRDFHEWDNVNLLKSGREWYGEEFYTQTEYDFNGAISDLAPDSVLKFTSSVIAKSFSNSSFDIYIGSNKFSQGLIAMGTGDYDPVATSSKTIFSVNANSLQGSWGIRYVYNRGSYASARGFLNYFEINASRALKLYGNQTTFRSVASTTQPVSQFLLDNASAGISIWDVTDPTQAQGIAYDLNGSTASFATNTNTLKEFIAFSGSNFANPVSAGIVPNQNLHGIGLSDLPDMIIVTHPDFKSAADNLARFRKDNDNLEVEVVTINEVYNEFSSGRQDISAVRDLMKMFYDRKTAADSVRYLLLFGDCSYDYKGRVSPNTNFIPVYETRESIKPIYSQSSDDYFGLLDDYEGNWGEATSTQNERLDIGIGRLPVKTLSEAQNVVNKIMHYSSSQECLGKWRNKITFVADDGDTNLHLISSENLANLLKTQEPQYNLSKIYLDAYPQIASPGGETSPATRDAIRLAIEKGTFIMNYTGHGGPTVWAQETILDIGEILKWDNMNSLTFFIAATCDFGVYDDPSVVSGGETTLLNSQGGSIGIICSTRPVLAYNNFYLNQAVYTSMFTPIGGKMPRLGDIFKLTKNNPDNLKSTLNRNYGLLGDPSLTLAYPKDNIIVTKVNGLSATVNDTLKALSQVTIEGEVRNASGVVESDFNGAVNITVFDKESVEQTFGTQGSPVTTFPLMNNFIYDGTASVSNGIFTVSFVVPKDISYQYDKGKISLYAKRNQGLDDAAGYNNNIIIGGTDTNFVQDNTPPAIKLYMNDESFVFGGLTAANPVFLAKMEDEHGINTAGQGIGHEITAVLDNSRDVLVLNEFYSSSKDNYKKGQITYPFKDLSPGLHSIKFKCWDTYNNSSEAYLEFVVVNDAKIALDHILNYPNPFSTHTTFHFDHNRAGDDLDVLIQVYSVAGKLIKTLDSKSFISNSHFSDLSWDGRDDFGDKIGKGVYVYKVHVRSLRDGSNISKFQKLVILN